MHCAAPRCCACGQTPLAPCWTTCPSPAVPRWGAAGWPLRVACCCSVVRTANLQPPADTPGIQQHSTVVPQQRCCLLLQGSSLLTARSNVDNFGNLTATQSAALAPLFADPQVLRFACQTPEHRRQASVAQAGRMRERCTPTNNSLAPPCTIARTVVLICGMACHVPVLGRRR